MINQVRPYSSIFKEPIVTFLRPIVVFCNSTSMKSSYRLKKKKIAYNSISLDFMEVELQNATIGP